MEMALVSLLFFLGDLGGFITSVIMLRYRREIAGAVQWYRRHPEARRHRLIDVQTGEAVSSYIDNFVH